MGIGMGQNLGHVPPGFVIGAGAVVLVPGLFTALRRRARELALTAIVAIAAFCLYLLLPSANASRQLSQVERGRQIYISEGCISCHSQYVRPNSPDELMWGPVETIQELRLQQPPLIGNRRQGPDLAEVGGRRSALWLKAHFFDPTEVSGASIMPSFGFLFRDERGDDLVAYLASLHTAGTLDHQKQESLWHPSPAALAQANPQAGEKLYSRYCATCHSPGGRTRGQAGFKRFPPDLTVGPFRYLHLSDSNAQRIDRFARIAKFGIPATDMPGHEYLSDSQIASISLWQSQSIRQPIQNK
jgi:cytochrome c oxidase cbb3-type subunit 2